MVWKSSGRVWKSKGNGCSFNGSASNSSGGVCSLHRCYASIAELYEALPKLSAEIKEFSATIKRSHKSAAELSVRAVQSLGKEKLVLFGVGVKRSAHGIPSSIVPHSKSAICSLEDAGGFDLKKCI